jgi:putative DNA primase/helicase
MLSTPTEQVVEFRNGQEIPPQGERKRKKNGPSAAIPHLNAISARDFLARDIPPRQMILNPILPECGIVMLHGVRGAGKTHFALAIGVAAASGQSFLRWKGNMPRKVLFVDGELPQSVLQSWLAEAVATAGGNHVGSNLTLITPDMQQIGIPDLATLEGQVALAEHVKMADLVILDNLSSLVRSGKENEAESWLPIQGWTLELRRQGKTVLFVHHSGRSGDPRGTSKRDDLLDTVIKLQSPHTYRPQEGLRVEVHFTKHRHFFGKDAEPFEAALSPGAEGVPVWTIGDIQLAGYDKAVKLFAEGCDVLAVKEELGISRATAFRYRTQWRQSQQSQAGETD